LFVFGRTKVRHLKKLEKATAKFEAFSDTEGETKTRVWG
jgi:hypothetical protein